MRIASATILLGIFLSSLSAGQGVPPGGGGGGATSPPTDSNPYNMANWKTDLPVMGSHTSDGYGWYRDTNGNVVQNPCNAVHVPPPPGPTISGLPSNSSGEYRNAYHHAQASVTIRWQWKGSGPAPLKVWVRKFATASATVSPNGSMSVSNGLGSPITDVDESPQKMKYQSGSKLQEVSLSGNNLDVSFSMDASATSTNSVAPYGNMAMVGLSYGISLKTSFIATTIGQTYYRESGTWNRRPASSDFTLTTVHVDPPSTTPRYDYNGNPLDWYWYAEILMLAAKVGYWVNPYHEWQAEGQTWTDSYFVERDSQWMIFSLTPSQLETLPDSGGVQKEVSLKTSDVNNLEDPTVIPSYHTVVLFAPIMHPATFGIDANPTYQMAPNFAVANPGYAVDGGGIACTWDETHVWWDVFNRIQQGADVGSQFLKNPWLKAIIKVLGLAIDEFEPKPNNATCNWIWGNDGCTYNGSPTPPFPIPAPGNWTTAFENWKMAPILKLKYRGYDVEGESWGGNGYQSRATTRAQKHEGFKWTANFTTVNGGSSGGFPLPGGGSSGPGGGGMGGGA